MSMDGGDDSKMAQSSWRDSLLKKLVYGCLQNFSLTCGFRCCGYGDAEFEEPQNFGETSCTNISRSWELSPSLWSTLPDSLVDLILRKLFQKLPVKDLVQYRKLSKECNEIILSGQSTQYQHMYRIPANCTLSILQTKSDSLLVYNSQMRIWSLKRLTFLRLPNSFPSLHCEVKPNSTNSLRLLTSDGGLLCFSTDVLGQYIVCNPITRRWKDLRLPLEFDQLSFRTLNPGHGNHMKRSSHGDRSEDSMVGLVTCRLTGNFKLLVAASVYENGDGNRMSLKTVLYDSGTGSWRNVAQAPIPPAIVTSRPSEICGERLIQFKKCVTCKGNVYCLVKYVHVFWELLKYAADNESWSVIRLRRKWQDLQLLEHQRSILLVEAISWSTYEFYKVMDSGPFPWIKVLNHLTNLLGPYIEDLGGSAKYRSTSLQCLGQGDQIFFVGKDHFRVLLFKSSDSSLEWIFRSSLESAEFEDIELATCFTFEPSLSRV